MRPFFRSCNLKDFHFNRYDFEAFNNKMKNVDDFPTLKESEPYLYKYDDTIFPSTVSNLAPNILHDLGLRSNSTKNHSTKNQKHNIFATSNIADTAKCNTENYLDSKTIRSCLSENQNCRCPSTEANSSKSNLDNNIDLDIPEYFKNI